jgi:3-oxoacyl-[acyl-carrier protein] reductase
VNLQLAGKVAVVTGAGRGIGRAVAQTLSYEGALVVLAARSADQLADAAAGCRTETLARPADLREPAAAAGLVAAAVERFGRLDILVNNAGATQRGDFLTLPDDAWADGFALKFFGAMRLCRAAWPHLRASGGSVVNIAGVAGRTPTADFAVGGAVNAAVLNLTKSLADRGIRDGVRVNAVNPGYVETDRLAGRIADHAREWGVSLEGAAERMAATAGIARFGQPDDIARLVAFLVSPAAAYLQGAVLDADGGQTRTL